MTEEEAKTKWCPFVRQVVYVEHPNLGVTAVSSLNRAEDDTAHGSCIGSACMAWRSIPSGVTEGMVVGARGEILEPGGPVAGPNGYCGLAGRP